MHASFHIKSFVLFIKPFELHISFLICLYAAPLCLQCFDLEEYYHNSDFDPVCGVRCSWTLPFCTFGETSFEKQSRFSISTTSKGHQKLFLQPHLHPHQQQAPAGPSNTPTHTRAHINTHRRHTHTHATTRKPRHAHEHRHHARTHSTTNTHTTINPPPNPTLRPAP